MGCQVRWDLSVQAASDIDTVNNLWKGLGYYSRAARLLSGAQKAVEKYGGRLPNNAKGRASNTMVSADRAARP